MDVTENLKRIRSIKRGISKGSIAEELRGKGILNESLYENHSPNFVWEYRAHFLCLVFVPVVLGAMAGLVFTQSSDHRLRENPALWSSPNLRTIG